MVPAALAPRPRPVRKSAAMSSSPPPSEPAAPAPTPAPESGASGSFPTLRTGRAGWRRFMRMWGFGLFLLLVVIFFRHVILPFVFAILIAFLLAPAVTRLSRLRIGKRHLPRGASVLICYAVLLSALGLFFMLLVPKLASDVERLFSNLPTYRERFEKEWAPRIGEWVEKTFPEQKRPAEALPPPDPMGVPPGTHVVVTPLPNTKYAITIESPIQIEKRDDGHYTIRPSSVDAPRPRVADRIRALPSILAQKWSSYVDELLGLGQWLVLGILDFFKTLVVVLMVAAFLLIDVDRVHGFMRSLVPREYRVHYDNILTGVSRGLTGVLRGQLVICLINGSLTYLGLLIFGVKYSLLLGLLAGIFSLIPIFGTILSSIPIVAIAMVSGEDGMDLGKGGIILGWILMIHFIEANFLNPRILGSSAKMHPVVVIFALIAGEHTYGLVGALLGVPAASIIQTLFLYLRDRAREQRGASIPPA